jgi:hypothetical protein
VSGKGATCAELIAALEAVRDENDTDDYVVWISDPKRTAPATGRILIDEIRESVGIEAGDPVDPRADDVREQHAREIRQYHADMRELTEAHAEYKRWQRVAVKALARGLRGAHRRLDPVLRDRLGKVLDAEQAFIRQPLGAALTEVLVAETRVRISEIQQYCDGRHPHSARHREAQIAVRAAEHLRHRAAVDYLRVMDATTAVRLALADYRSTFGALRHRLSAMTEGRLDAEEHEIHTRAVIDMLFSYAGPVFARLTDVGGDQLATLAQEEQMVRWRNSLRRPDDLEALMPNLDRLAAARNAVLAEVERLGRERLT